MRSRIVVAILLLSLVFRLAFVLHDLRDMVIRGPLYDDSFYAFGVARNIAAGLGSTFDGVETTNGYQPLYVFLLVPLYWLAGGHPTLPIYAVLVLSSVLNVLTGYCLYRLVRRAASWWAAVFALVLWGFGPAIVRQAVNGLETALAMFLLAACLEYYLAVYRAARRPRRRHAAALGLLLGLAILARIDAALFALALGADMLVRGRRRALRSLATLAFVAGTVLLPWCVASQSIVGSVIPESGIATRLLSEAYAPHDDPSLAGVSFADGPPAAFLAHNLQRSVLQLGTSPVLHVVTRSMERALMALDLTRATLHVVLSLVLLCVLAAVFPPTRRRLLGRASQRDFGFLYLYSALLVAAYSFVVFGQIFYSRYYYPVFFFSIVLGAFAFEILLGLVRARKRPVLAAAIIAVYAVALPLMTAKRLHNGDYRFLQVVDWIEAHTEPDARIGVFNCGAIGYFSDRDVVNLDGKVNSSALRALRTGALPRYVAERGIDYVIDHEWILGRFLLQAPADAGLGFARVDDDVGVPGWCAYRVVPVAAAASEGAGTHAARLRP